jgi:DUF971 family protein
VNRKLSIPILGQGDPNRPKDVHLVGRYALGVDWTDGHGSIFPFDHLRRLCPCGACATLESAPAAATWPQDIKKLDDALRIRWSDGHESRLAYVDLRAGCRCAACTGVHG